VDGNSIFQRLIPDSNSHVLPRSQHSEPGALKAVENRSCTTPYSELYARHKELRDEVGEARREVSKLRETHAEKIRLLRSISESNKVVQVSNQQIESLIEAILIIVDDSRTPKFSSGTFKEKIECINGRLKPLATWNQHIAAILRFISSLQADPIKPGPPDTHRSRSKSPNRKNWCP
jgi:hypothetical protein